MIRDTQQTAAHGPPSGQPYEVLLDQLAEIVRGGDDEKLETFLSTHRDQQQQLRQMLPTVRVMAQMGVVGEADNAEVAPDHDAMRWAGGKTLGDFRIIREIGYGGMGVVYLAEQVSLHRQVALKILPLAAVMDPRQLQRFKNEVQAVALLQHANIVPVYSVGSERGVHYYAMQYIAGHTLADVIAHLRRLAGIGPVEEHATDRSSKRSEINAALTRDFQSAVPLGSPTAETQPMAALSTAISEGSQSERFRSVARLMIQAAEALDHAHTRGVLHRDVKPGNLMVDATGNLWILDFGLARLEGDLGMTMTGDMVGTLRYMSPEQALTKRVVVDHRTDIYSLGATLYELLTLRAAYEASDRQEMLKRIAFEDPRGLRKIDAAIPAELETITQKAMEKSPTDRYETAQNMADDLRRYLDNQPILAKPPSLVDRTIKWSRRHRSLVAAATVIMVLAVMTLSIGTVLFSREQGKTLAALKEAKANAERSRAEAAKANSVIGLFDEMLGSANPFKVAKGADYTYRQLLDQFATGLDQQLGDQSEVEATIRLTIGKAYQSLDLYDRAEPQLKTAVDLRRRAFGEDHEKFAESLVAYADTLRNTVQVTKAEVLIQEAIAIYRRRGSETDGFVHALIVHGWITGWRLDNLEKAEAIYREALQVARRLHPEEHFLVGRILSNIAYFLNKRGDHTEAERLAKNALAILRKAKPADNSSIAYALDNLGQIREAQGDHSEAEASLREAVEVFRKVGGDKNPRMGFTLLALADVLEARGKHAEADGLRRAGMMLTLEGWRKVNVSYKVRIQIAGEYQLYLRFDGHDSASRTLYARIMELANGTPESVGHVFEYVGSHPDANFRTYPWEGSGRLNGWGGRRSPAVWTIPSAGDYTIQLTGERDGAAVDALVLQLSSLPAPKADGPDESPTAEDGIFMESEGRIVVEAEHFTNRSQGDASWRKVPEEDSGDVKHLHFRGSGYIQFLPDQSPHNPAEVHDARGQLLDELGRHEERQKSRSTRPSLTTPKRSSLIPTVLSPTTSDSTSISERKTGTKP